MTLEVSFASPSKSIVPRLGGGTPTVEVQRETGPASAAGGTLGEAASVTAATTVYPDGSTRIDVAQPSTPAGR